MMIVHVPACQRIRVSTDKNSPKATQQDPQMLGLLSLTIFTVVWMPHQGPLVMVKVKFQPFAGKIEVVPRINAKIYVRGSRNAIFISITFEAHVISFILASELGGALLKASREYVCRNYGPNCFIITLSPTHHVFSFLLFQFV